MADFTTLSVLTNDPIASFNTTSGYGAIVVSDEQWLKNFQHLNVSFRFVMGILAIGGNLLTVVAIARFDYLRSCTNYLIAALAIADMFGGFNCLLVLINHIIPMSDETWKNMCGVESSLNIFSAGLNLCYILYISVDRFIFITFPLRYHSLVRPRFIFAGIAIFIVIDAVQVLTSNFIIDEYNPTPGRVCRALFPEPVTLMIDIWFYMITPVTVLLYMRIGWIAYKQRRAIEQSQNIATNQQHKITKMMSLVLGVYLACYVPQYIIFSLEGYFSRDTYIVVERVSSWFWWINSWANPFIYAWKNKDFKRAFRSLLHLKAPNIHPEMNLYLPN